MTSQTAATLLRTPFVALATARYRATVDAGKPMTRRFLCALATRLACAAHCYEAVGEMGRAQFCADRANECRGRAADMRRV